MPVEPQSGRAVGFSPLKQQNLYGVQPDSSTAMPSHHLSLTLVLVLLASYLCGVVGASNTSTSSGIQWVEYTEPDGQNVWLMDDRRPALYTSDFGDCAGGSLIDLTRFDAAYYKDNMTVTFHLQGSSMLTNESLMLYIGVYAYGENRFNLTFDPCNANIFSLCPVNASVPIEAQGIIPVAPEDVASIPSIALVIPDFEGQAILRVFSNSSESQIACFSAVVTNGSSFSQPSSVGTALGICALIALIASTATAVYGQYAPETRKHYAHSLSVLVVFSVFQHIYFTGALSMNWPSVLVAFWNNFAWSAGMINSSSIQSSIVKFLHGNLGNITIVGSAPSGENALGLGGGYSSSQIYRRDASLSDAYPSSPYGGLASTFQTRDFEHSFARRGLENRSSGFSWYGNPVQPGLPLPGNFSSFAGTLAEQGIPTAAAFLTGLIWFVVILGLVGISMAALKLIIEACVAARLVKSDRLDFFRRHWLAFMGSALLRTCFIAFFMMMFLCIFQFAYGGPAGVIALAAITFIVVFVVMIGAAAYAVFCYVRSDRLVYEPDRLSLERKRLGFIPWFSIVRESKISRQDEAGTVTTSLPWWRLNFVGANEDRHHVHDDEIYLRRFGWLTARFRRSKWWFFSFWLVYEFVRACFYGGAVRSPLAQVFGLLVVEIVALLIMILLRPFESNRLNIVMIYLLGFSKVATLALSAAFMERFNQPRILTTVIGIVIIVIQGLLTVCLLIAIALGAVSSYMSIMRHRERKQFFPSSWRAMRAKYYKHVDQKATDKAPPPNPKKEQSEPSTPYFEVANIRKEPKIEENLEEEQQKVESSESVEQVPTPRDPFSRTQSMISTVSVPASPYGPNVPFSRTQSMRSTVSASGLPYGAKRHRTSWSARDFQEELGEEAEPSIHARYSIESVREAALRHRASSLRASSGNSPLPEEPEAVHEASSDDQPRARRTASGKHTQRPRMPRQSSTLNEENEDNEGPVEKGPSAVRPTSPVSTHNATTATHGSTAGSALAAAVAAAQKSGTGNSTA